MYVCVCGAVEKSAQLGLQDRKNILKMNNPYCTEVWMTILESGWNLWVWLVGVVSRRWVWLVGGIYGYGYNV